jgi:competence/damage-inducible protein CinA-like protein
MRIEIIATGSELVAGKTIDTNSAMLARLLGKFGLEVAKITLVGDPEEQIILALNEAVGRAEAIIITGGLGPTQDDRTRFAAAKVFGQPLIEDPGSIDRLVELFKLFRREMPESNRVQALFPENAMIIENPMGTARGFTLENQTCLALFAPGVPSELEAMAEASLVPMLVEKAGITETIASVTLLTFGHTESGLADDLKDFEKKYPKVELAYSAKFPVIEIRITARDPELSVAEKNLSQARAYLDEKIGGYVFSQDGKTLAAVVQDLMIARHWTLALAESCTGGMIASAITDIPGSSEHFIECAVTYSNDAKERRLGVKKQTMIDHGAVSKETAIEMAIGIREASGADIGLAVTGVAGPGESEAKPAGLVHMALSHRAGQIHWENRFPGDRRRVRVLTAHSALNRIRKFCLKSS